MSSELKTGDTQTLSSLEQVSGQHSKVQCSLLEVAIVENVLCL